VHLDLIRGVSALAVMLGHVRGLFFVDYSVLGGHPSLFLRMLYALTGFGHQAVIVFFVLSGYFIGNSVLEQIRGHRWSWRVYLVNRLTRLELVLLPALLLGTLWDQLGMRLPQAAAFYYGGLYKYYPPSVALRSTVPVFLSNLFFLQSIVAPVLGSNGPLWSLSYEFWYYLLFPILLLAIFSWTGIRSRVLYLGLTFLLFWFIGGTISVYFLIWLLGVVIGQVWRIQPGRSAWVWAAITLIAAAPLIAALGWVRMHPNASEMRGDVLIGICFALWTYFILQSRRTDAAPAYSKTSRALAAFSYTLYLTHFPLLLLVRGWLDPEGNWQPDAMHLAYGTVLAFAVLAFAYILARFTEARTGQVRRRVMYWLTPPIKEAVQ